MTDKRAEQQKTDVEKSAINGVTDALRVSMTAINDWLRTYASDQCLPEQVIESRARIRDAGGTLSYIAKIQQTNRTALSKIALQDGKCIGDSNKKAVKNNPIEAEAIAEMVRTASAVLAFCDNVTEQGYNPSEADLVMEPLRAALAAF